MKKSQKAGREASKLVASLFLSFVLHLDAEHVRSVPFPFVPFRSIVLPCGKEQLDEGEKERESEDQLRKRERAVCVYNSCRENGKEGEEREREKEREENFRLVASVYVAYMGRERERFA